MSENAGPNLGHRFQKGQSGNPAGKPKGARHKTTLMAERLTPGEAVGISQLIEALVRKLRKVEWEAGRSGMTPLQGATPNGLSAGGRAGPQSWRD
jgi:hypothetical protein